MYNKRISVEQWNAVLDYWRSIHKAKIRLELQAKPTQIDEEQINDIPDPNLNYRLACTLQEANEIIANNENPVPLVFVGVYGKEFETPKNGRKLQNWSLIQDNRRKLCIYFRGKFYRWYF